MDVNRLRTDLINEEGLRLKPYRCTSGKLTIGVGRNLDDVGISETEAEYLLDNDIKKVVKQVGLNIPFFGQLSDARQRALCNMAFQMGIKGLLGFKNMLKHMGNGDFIAAGNAAKESVWFKQTPQRAKRVIDMIKGG